MKADKSDEKRGKQKGQWKGKHRKGNKQRQNARAEERASSNATPSQSSFNDVSWYSHYPELLSAGASFPYPYRPGMKVLTTETGGDPNSWRYYPIPGVCTIRWIPSLGYSDSVTDPASIVAKEIYGKVRGAYSGSLAADPPDFVIYLGALDSIFSYIGWLKRVFRLLSSYTPQNFVIPEGILFSLGFSKEQITYMQSRRMELFQRINELIHMTRKFTCPAQYDYFNRHFWMNDNVYTDSPSINSQFYVFNQLEYYRFSMIDTPDGVPAGGLSLRTLSFAEGPDDNILDILYSWGLTLMDHLSSWDESYTISGYLSRAYEGTPSFEVPLLDFAETVTPVYSEEVLTQIENITAPLGNNRYSCEVSQDPKTNRIISKPYTVGVEPDAYMLQVSGLSTVLTIRSDAPTPADSVIATRLVNHLGPSYTEEEETRWPIIAGTEVVGSMSVTTRNASDEWVNIPIHMLLSADGNQQTQTTMLAEMTLLAQFDWHPRQVMRGMIAQIVNTTGLYPAYDIHNLAVLRDDDLRNLHKICVYSEWNAFS